MLVDIFKRKVPTEDEILPPLLAWEEQQVATFDSYLRRRSALVKPLAEYLSLRAELSSDLLGLMRSEEEAKEDFAAISTKQLQSYGTQMAHHQSSKALVATVEAITIEICARHGKTVNVNPQRRASAVADDHLWVSPRRLDGAFPGLSNPQALWEIKEYWGKTSGGSKMSDAIYECQLVGTELRAFEALHGVKIKHYALLDGRHQWSARISDLRRAVDLLYSGLLDELIVGREVLTTWPKVVEELCLEDVTL
ncbi:DUF7687 domain-containing protein [Saccharothrix sp. ALI-22-I]|uniref:DUF7687 domain-containing protein n=1 Tax=Saccharothrix sp. ALI-22-I TaxID=1933778 RepID=UPI00117B9488|nr:hypothetical protein [Saccharothrix sp. ALI-22-I]